MMGPQGSGKGWSASASRAGDRARSDLTDTSLPTESGAVGCRGGTRSRLAGKACLAVVVTRRAAAALEQVLDVLVDEFYNVVYDTRACSGGGAVSACVAGQDV